MYGAKGLANANLCPLFLNRNETVLEQYSQNIRLENLRLSDFCEARLLMEFLYVQQH